MESGAGDNWVNLDYLLVGGGSGWGDMVLYVPNVVRRFNHIRLPLFGIRLRRDIYRFPRLRQRLRTRKYRSQAGFEEWWVPGSTTTTQSPAVPEPASLLLCGSGLLLVAKRYRLRAVVLRKTFQKGPLAATIVCCQRSMSPFEIVNIVLAHLTIAIATVSVSDAPSGRSENCLLIS
jgi:hypothetical protein